jgi:hypothetical protein
MNRRPYFAWLGVGLAVITAFSVGVYAGIILGVDQFQKRDSSAKASVLTTELRALRAGDVEKIIRIKEIELDGSVVSALAFQESGMPWLFWPYAHSLDHEYSLKRVAQYRRQHPPVVPGLVSGTETYDADAYDPRPFAREVVRSTEVLIERYGR